MRRVATMGAALVTMMAGFAVSSPVASTAAECVPVPLAAFGSTPMPATHQPDETGYRCFLVTTERAGPYVVRAGVESQPRVLAPDGGQLEEENPALLRSFHVYQFEATTTYRVMASALDGTTFAVYDVLGGDGCPHLADVSWGAPEERVSLAGQVVPCRAATAAEGSILRMGGTVDDEQILVDGDGDWLCTSQGGTVTRGCSLDQGSGPYRLIAGDPSYQEPWPTDMSLVDVSSEAGCTRHQPMTWGAGLPAARRDPSTRWECFAFTARSTGTHLVRTLGPVGFGARFEIWDLVDGLRYDVEEGDRHVDGFRYLRLDAGVEYRILVRGGPTEQATDYHLGVFDLSREEGCGTVATDWGSPPASGSSTTGALDCYSFDVDSPGKYRVQVERESASGSVSGLVAGPGGAVRCGSVGPRGTFDRIGTCRLREAGRYRAIAGHNEFVDPAPARRRYAMYVTEVGSPGCPAVPRATWGRPLPAVGQADGSAYQCWTVTTGATANYTFGRWQESWNPDYALWAVDTESQTESDEGLPRVDRPLDLMPHTTYRVVVWGDGENAVGEHRFGLYENADLTGCPVITDVSWSAPPIRGTATRGELDCRLLPGRYGDLFHLDDPDATIGNRVGGYCPHDMCRLEGETQGPWRVVSGGDGDYQYRVHRVADRSGCPAVPVAPESAPIHVSVGPEGRACFAVDVEAGPLASLLDVGSADSHVRLYDADDGRECALEREEFCAVGPGPHVVVIDNDAATGPPAEVDLQLREYGAGSTGCAPLTALRVTGVLNGTFDEECYTVTLPRGTMFGDEETADSPVEPILRILDDGGWTACPYVDACAAPGGRLTISVSNGADSEGRFALRIYPLTARFSQPPRMRGRAVVGKRLRVEVGTPYPGHSVSVAWLRHRKVVDRGRTHRVTRRDAGRVLRARVTVRSPGYAPSVVVLRSDRVKRRR